MSRYHGLLTTPSSCTQRQCPGCSDSCPPPADYYPNCEVVFMGMANIHSIRKSFQSLRFLCTQIPDPAKWVPPPPPSFVFLLFFHLIFLECPSPIIPPSPGSVKLSSGSSALGLLQSCLISS